MNLEPNVSILQQAERFSYYSIGSSTIQVWQSLATAKCARITKTLWPFIISFILKCEFCFVQQGDFKPFLANLENFKNLIVRKIMDIKMKPTVAELIHITTVPSSASISSFL